MWRTFNILWAHNHRISYDTLNSFGWIGNAMIFGPLSLYHLHWRSKLMAKLVSIPFKSVTKVLSTHPWVWRHFQQSLEEIPQYVTILLASLQNSCFPEILMVTWLILGGKESRCPQIHAFTRIFGIFIVI